ncbi:hypothetical protein DFP72DRAFT_811429 [Ephemerocybe angulata]|uniref:F-box domain-containing protein n=1 Tax=Ephemerocybe angulata TaxID=980116 RepID=A0A8H6HYK5_9AGAR|nr:hypothetical protein DFP72DRAFT_811429 [Tulosesus angulatus]
MLEDLPVELLDLICKFVTKLSDLSAAASASSLLHDVASRVLFETVSIRGHTLPAATTLSSTPHLAQHVHSFNVSIGVGFTVPPSFFCPTLGLAISNMSNLVSLSISLPKDQTCVALHTRLDSTFPRLTSLQASFQSLDAHFLEFISKTPNLASLVLDQVNQAPLPHIPQTLLPKLASFSGSAQLAAIIIPGRPVSSISLTSGLLSAHVASVLAQSTAEVLELDATTDSPPLPILQTLGVVMPKLVHLRLGTNFDFWDESFNAASLQTMKNTLMVQGHLKLANIAGVVWKWSELENRRRTLTTEPRPFLHDELNNNGTESSFSTYNYDTYSY